MLTLSFSNYKAYKACPARYKAQAIDKVKEPSTERDRYNRAFGSVMGDLSHSFYKKKMFMRLADGRQALYQVFEELRTEMRERLAKRLVGIKLGVKGRPLTFEQIVERCEQALRAFLALVVREKLYGTYTASEVVLSTALEKYHLTLTGRPDLVIVRQLPGEPLRNIILDGKSKPSQSVTDDQLLWYGVQWYYKFHVLATDLGFLYFEPTKTIPALDLRRFTETDLQAMVGDILGVRDAILADTKFQPVVNSQCWNCPIRAACKISPHFRGENEAVRQALDQSVDGVVDWSGKAAVSNEEGALDGLCID